MNHMNEAFEESGVAGADHADAIETADCIVVGGGPAGLTAAIYLRRFHRDVRVIDSGNARARRISRSHNIAGFPEGIAGDELLRRMADHLQLVGGSVVESEVCAIVRANDGLFDVRLTRSNIRCRYLLLCTGVVDRPSATPGACEIELADLMRYCPVCDGYEYSDKRIGVLANSGHGLEEARFLKNFSDSVVIIPTIGSLGLREQAAEDGISCLEAIATRLSLSPAGHVLVQMSNGQQLTVDVVYSALGVDPRVSLARSLGVRLDNRDGILVDAHCRTNVPNVYAAGDVVSALDQISVAVGHAAIAATAIHNDLRAARPR
jgi:thioredoxin reductase (NADPH)